MAPNSAQQPEAMTLATLIAAALPDVPVPDGCDAVTIKGLCQDSRIAEPGHLFIAVPGTRVRGSAFAHEAVSRGAVAVVTEAAVDIPPGAVVVTVPNAHHALARLAAVFYGLDRIQAEGGLVVTGITGTNGKTTIAHMVQSILRTAGRQAAMLGTIEYDLVGRKVAAALTTPDAITLTQHLVEAHRAGATRAVMEASSHSLDQRRVDGIDFSAAIFTNLTQDHLDYHRTPEDYLLAKKRLFDGLQPGALAVVNCDDPAGRKIVEDCRGLIIRYGIDGPADMPVNALEVGPNGCRFVLEHEAGPVNIQTAMVGRHNAMNALAAATAALAMGIEPSAVERGIAELRYVPGRLQPIDTGTLGFSVYVDYAHTDDALRNVLQAARPLTRGKLWCVFGCGGDRDRTKRTKMARAVAEGADMLIVTSDNPRTEDPLAIISDIEEGLTREDRERTATEPDRTCAIAYAISRLEPDDTLVIAGKGHEDYQILGTEKMHFDDVEVAEGAIRRRLGK